MTLRRLVGCRNLLNDGLLKSARDPFNGENGRQQKHKMSRQQR